MDARYYVSDRLRRDTITWFWAFWQSSKRARSHFIIELTVINSANVFRYWLADNIKKLMTIRTFIYS